MSNEERLEEITPMSEDFSRWYQDIVRRAELADYAPVRGCMVIRPYGYSIWERIQEGLDRRFKATGHKNAYFPMFIPESLLQKEAEHVEGFAPEVAWVTRGGSEELTEPLAIRPSSETIFGHMYAKWIESYRDLPVLINQWANIVRWEMVTRPFLRTTEFLWQEGHTAHRTSAEAMEETLRILDLYRDFVENEMAVPVFAGEKTSREKFAGAQNTYTIEALMRDGKALQAGTSHYLGQNFSKAYDIDYLDDDGQLKHVWTTSWGVSTRLIGALIMVHGDDRGLIIPPRVAPIQVVIVPITPSGKKELVLSEVAKLKGELSAAGFRFHSDERDQYTPGWKFNEWEMRGVPVRVEIGPRDIKNAQVVLVRRDTGEKCQVSRGELKSALRELLLDIQNTLFQRALDFRNQHTHRVKTLQQLELQMEEERGFAVAGYCGRDACEEEIKEKTKATVRCVVRWDEAEQLGSELPVCPVCGAKSDQAMYLARAY